jgi:very-short-patch-repair endonuclease
METTNGMDFRRPTIQEMISYANEMGEFKAALNKCNNYFQSLKVIKDFYLKKEPEIIALHRRNPCAWFESYPCDWSKYFSPIEFNAWCSIRSKGQIVLYPQYPVLNYHLDFANPGLRIGLELDGKQFHDQQRDIKRDNELKRAGWTIYRITGAEMVKAKYMSWFEIQEQCMYNSEAFQELENWLLHTGDGVMTALRYIHFIEPYQTSVFDEDEEYEAPDLVWERYKQLCSESLYRHSLEYRSMNNPRL